LSSRFRCPSGLGVLGYGVRDDLREPVRRRVGGSLTRVAPLKRLEMLRRNALFLRGGVWKPPVNDGTHVRKAVGSSR
jgi:hypothetical protein